MMLAYLKAALSVLFKDLTYLSSVPEMGTLMYCNRLHAWWSIQSRLATLLSSFIAHRWVGLQTL